MKKDIILREILFATGMIYFLVVFMLYLSHQYIADNRDIDNESGYTFFYSYYGENDINDLQKQYSAKEQYHILTKFKTELNKKKYPFYIWADTGYGDTSFSIVNQLVMEQEHFPESIETGKMIPFVKKVNPKENIVIPALVGKELGSKYKPGSNINVPVCDGFSIHLQVYGVLKNTTVFKNSIIETNVNDAIIIPELIFTAPSDTETILNFQNEILESQCNGYFKYDQQHSYDEIQSYSNQLAKKYQLEWRCADKIENEMENVKLPVTLKQTIFLSAIGICVFTFCIIILCKNQKFYISKKYCIQEQTHYIILHVISFFLIYEISWRGLTFFMSSTFHTRIREARCDVFWLLAFYVAGMEIFCCKKIAQIYKNRIDKVEGV